MIIEAWLSGNGQIASRGLLAPVRHAPELLLGRIAAAGSQRGLCLSCFRNLRAVSITRRNQ
jgi:hypothetical protein